MTTAERKQRLKDQRAVHRVLAKRKLTHFATYMDEVVEIEWFHKIVYDKLDEWVAGKINKLAIFMPPQHGKSTMSSIVTPAKILGEFPKARIAVCSFSDSLASKFNRACQDIIDSDDYRSIYPKTILPGKGVEGKTNELRNNTYFETIRHKGSFKAVSIGGSLTGDPVDFGIIDDPFKDRKQANSATYRETVWDWYTDVFLKRLHNKSRQLMLFTRWHEDDLAGRLFNPKNEHYNKEEADEWTVLCFQSLKEEKLPMPNAMKYDDPRKIDEALWESKHSAEKHKRTRERSPVSFASLEQQRPSPAKGNKIKRDWFEYMNENELPFNPRSIKKDFFIDGAFTAKTENDETAQLSCTFYGGKLYIFNCHGVRKELYEYLDYIKTWLKSAGYRPNSSVWIEMKASGYGMYSMLRSKDYGSHNCRKVSNKTVAEGKMTRVESCQPILASGKVVLVRGSWNESFVDQCASFPNDVHDDMVDVLAYAIYEYFIGEGEVEIDWS